MSGSAQRLLDTRSPLMPTGLLLVSLVGCFSDGDTVDNSDAPISCASSEPNYSPQLNRIRQHFDNGD